MTSKAIVLCSGEVSILDRHLARLIEALGVQCKMVQIEHIGSLEASFADLCFMISAASLADLLKNTRIPPDIMARVFECVPFLLVYGIAPNNREVSAVRQLTDGLVSSVVPLDRPDLVYEVSTAERAITQEFSGLAFGPIHPERDFGLVLPQHQTGFSNLVSINTLPLFGSFKKRHAQVFLLACHAIADLDAPIAGSWSTQEYFSRLVPIMMFLRHVFHDQLWHNPHRYANLIIDDPLLRDSYGCLNYARLLQEMDRGEFTTTIAFIPWNHRRTSDSVARLFQARADRFSLCPHGCNHTEGEFASAERRHLNRLLHVATQRMQAHAQHTGVPYADVMVFPQGQFSTASLELLKRHNYLAAVNSMDAITPLDRDEAPGLTMADFLAPAISKYGDFPLFVRRYPGTVADFALDLFLGKPALLVEHHHYFKNGYDNIRECVNQINALSANLQWTNLGHLISHTYLQRTLSADTMECRIFANRQRICNQDVREKQYIIRKHEDGVTSVQKVLLNGKDYSYEIKDNHLVMCVDIPPASSLEITIDYDNEYLYEPEVGSIVSDIKVSMRRYFSEFRDNYMCRHETLLKSLYRVKKHLF